MNSPILRLKSRDFINGAVTAVIAAVLVSLYGVFSQPNVDLFSIDWNSVLRLALNAAASAFVGYLGKNFLTDENGKVLGKI